MKATLDHQANTYKFNIEHEGKHYEATIYMNEASSKFQDWEVVDSNGDFAERDIEDEIIEYIDKNWDKL